MAAIKKIAPYSASLLLAVNVKPAFSADCWRGNAVGYCGGPFLASTDNAWAALQDYCGNGLWQNQGCYVNNRVSIQFTNPGANGQQICWDALENIIEQCKNGDYSTGHYEWNDSYYTMYFCGRDTCGAP